jgi:hypothetical protein
MPLYEAAAAVQESTLQPGTVNLTVRVAMI